MHGARVRIALALFGLPRASHLTFPSIEARLIAPLHRLGELRIACHLWRQQNVANPRSGEDEPLPDAAYAPFLHLGAAVQDPPPGQSPLMLRLQGHGDAWDDGFRSLANCLLQLQSLLAVTEAVAALAPDVVVFARPDLLYHDLIAPDDIAQALEHPDGVALPGWGAWGGCNDRFAIAGARAWRAYGGRLLLADHYCERTRRPLHAESFLRYALAFAGVPVRTIGLRASRVRLGGWMEREDFDLPAGFNTARTGPPGP